MKLSLPVGILAVLIVLPRLGRPAELILALAILGRCAYELYGSLRLPSPAFRTAACSIFMVLGIIFLVFAIVTPLPSISYVCLIVLAFSLRRYGVPRVGLLGGALAALAVALLLRGAAGWLGAIGSWIAITLAALAGAWIASWVKSKADIKGFGRRGNAGVLDYFDSFLFAAPVALAVLSR